jgi:hypothetical protein
MQNLRASCQGAEEAKAGSLSALFASPRRMVTKVTFLL